MSTIGAPIMHPTDFSDLSMNAFIHALSLSIAAKSKLYVVHVTNPKAADEWQSFPHVRQMLARWGLLDADASTAAIFDRLGVQIVKVEIGSRDPVHGLTRFIAGHPSGLMVLATRGREGLPRWGQSVYRRGNVTCLASAKPYSSRPQRAALSIQRAVRSISDAS